MPHQEEAVTLLREWSGCGLLAMEPGTGKTLASLEFLRREQALPALIIAPVTIIGMWRDELARWYPELSVGVVRGTKIQRAKVYAEKHDVYLMGYETFRNEFVTASKLPVVACILDESGKIRTPTAKVSKAIRAFQPRVRIALDGTPVSNGIADLWNISEWVRPRTFYGNWWAFKKKHAIMNPYIPGKVDGWRDTEWITKKASERIFWKKKTEVLADLPPCSMLAIPLQPTPEEKRVYKQIKEELRIEFEGEEITITNALALLMRLRQAANGMFTRPDMPTKTQAIIDLVSTLPPQEKVVIFTQFETVVQNLGTSLPFPHVAITGAMKPEERDATVKRFESDPAIRAIIMTSAGEKGLNLQCASYMIQHDLVWSAAAEEQRIGRIWRHGQMRACTVWNLLMEGTVDMHMRKILERKKKIADAVASIDAAQADPITMQEIRDILEED